MIALSREDMIQRIRYAISALLSAEMGALAEGYQTEANDMVRAREGLLEVAEQL